jgi:hypothetical protein
MPSNASSRLQVIDELCHCGLLRSDHDHLVEMRDGREMVLDCHGGGCQISGCVQFTWKRMIYERSQIPLPMPSRLFQSA